MSKLSGRIRPLLKRASAELRGFSQFLFFFFRKKVLTFSHHFERNKNLLVKFFLMKRGRYNRPFLHLTTMGVLGVGVLIAPILADTYPMFAANSAAVLSASTNTKEQSILVGEDVFNTKVSDKPRDKVLDYTVERGDTIYTVAKKFKISVDTIKWENDLASDTLAVGDTLKILPVSGIAHKVSKGDTIYTIAKKYDAEPQAIADFPFNDFANPETFSLVDGQLVIVPEGIKPTVPQAQRSEIKRQSYVAQAPVGAASGGGFVFPLPGNTGISQYPSWYHMALDITAPVGTPIVAANSGTVTLVEVGGWNDGYGTNLYIDNGAGLKSHYAHMNGVNLSAGQQVSAGQVVGWVGLTGRTTGAHLHFEIYKGGVLVNPLPYLP